MSTVIKCQSIITPHETLTPGAILVSDDGRIAAARQELQVPAGAERFDLPEATILPGFIDIHVHGGGGYSLATRSRGEIEEYARWVVAHGVTSFVPTICAGTLEEGFEFVRTAARATGPVKGGANVIGLNLEGPFVNPKRRGALPAGWIAPPDLTGFERLVEAAEGKIRVLTLAPEIPGAADVLRAAVASGPVVSVGHTDATHDDARDAFEAGASHVTHAFNGMRPFHHRDPGPVFAAVGQNDVTIELIADGVHLHQATVRAMIRLIGPHRGVLVSDGVPPAGQDGGSFALGHEGAHLEGDRVTLPDGTIAGSSATMVQIVRNLMNWGVTGGDIGAVGRMASTTPARVLGLDDRKGQIAEGYDADLVALDSDFAVVMTWVDGRPVYRRD